MVTALLPELFLLLSRAESKSRNRNVLSFCSRVFVHLHSVQKELDCESGETGNP